MIRHAGWSRDRKGAGPKSTAFIRARSLTLAALFVLSACGYRPLVRDRAASERFCVLTQGAAEADAAVSAAAEAGARQVLARADALGSCDQAHRIVIAVSHIASAPEGIVSAGGLPQGRGTHVRVMASARVDGGEEFRSEGEATVATSSETWSESLAQRDARALAGRRAGERLARRVLGEPSPGP